MNQRSPRNEPEVMRANAHHFVADCNRICRKPYGNEIFQALELAEVAYKVHRLPYVKGLSGIDRFPPDRFTWLCDESGDAKECVKVRDNKSGKVVVWPDWRG